MIAVDKMKRFFLLCCNLIDSKENRDASYYCQEGAEEARFSWIVFKDATRRYRDMRAYNFSMQRMVNPFSCTQKEKTKEKEESLSICDSLCVNNQRYNCSKPTKPHKCMISVLYLKPGVKFHAFPRFCRIRFSCPIQWGRNRRS